MREILFRGKTRTGEWVYGDLLNLHNGDKYIVNNKFGACIDDKGNFINTESPFVCKVNPETVGQFTGLIDKNGKKIFEGDIVLLKARGSVKNADIKVIVEDIFISDSIKKYLQNGFIIGNIHDNPELLGEQK